MARYECMICGHIYDESEEGVSWDALPDDWSCPICGADKSQFERIDAPVAAATQPVATAASDDEPQPESSPSVSAVPASAEKGSARGARRPNRIVVAHRFFGYIFVAIYVILLIQMVPRLWTYQVEFPARTVLHIALGMAVGTMLALKIAIVRFFRRLDPVLVPMLGTSILVGSVVLIGISVPTALREAMATARLFTPENRGRVKTLLVNAGLEQVPAERLATVQSLRAGQWILRRKCTTCHDLRTVLARPRTPTNWRQTVQRMASRTIVEETLSADEQWQVTAYLVALSPQLQRSLQQLRTEQKQQHTTQSAVESVTNRGSYEPQAAAQLFKLKCSQCHDSQLVATAPPSSTSAARALVAQMVGEGLEASDAELATIVRYLTETYVTVRE